MEKYYTISTTTTYKYRLIIVKLGVSIELELDAYKNRQLKPKWLNGLTNQQQQLDYVENTLGYKNAGVPRKSQSIDLIRGEHKGALHMPNLFLIIQGPK